MDNTRLPGRESIGEVSEGASRAFAEALPRLLTLVNDKFFVDTRLFSRFTPEHLSLVSDAHRHFGDMLRAVFEFSLYDHMVREFAWYVSALSSRGLDEDYFRNMVEGWIIAVHAALPPRQAREVSRVLEWLALNTPAVYAERHRAGALAPGPARQFLDMALGGRRREAARYLLGLMGTAEDAEEILAGVVLPAMGEIGRLWEANEISVADEHAATEISRYALERLMDEVPTKEPLGLSVVVGCVPGEQHDIGAMLTAAYMETKGWEVFYLGRSTPEKDLLSTVAKTRPEACVFSITLIARLPEAKDLFMSIRREAPGIRILAGGHAADVAAEKLSSYVDAVAGGIREAHDTALRLVRRDA
jgi:methanogenic corrinoid protein MtbC1